MLHKQNFDSCVMKKLNINNIEKDKNIDYLESFIKKFTNPNHEVKIAICG